MEEDKMKKTLKVFKFALDLLEPLEFDEKKRVINALTVFYSKRDVIAEIAKDLADQVYDEN